MILISKFGCWPWSLSPSERKLENLKNMQRLAWQLCTQMWSLGPSLGLSPNMKYMADTLQHLGVMPNTNIEVLIYFKRDRVSTNSSGAQGLHLLPWISTCCSSHMFKCNIIYFFGISPCGWQKIKKLKRICMVKPLGRSILKIRSLV